MSRHIIQNSTSSCTCTYLKEQYFVNQANYPNTVVVAVALITSFGANSGRNGGGGGGQNAEEPDAVVVIHLAVDSNDNSDNDDRSVESF